MSARNKVRAARTHDARLGAVAFNLAAAILILFPKVSFGRNEKAMAYLNDLATRADVAGEALEADLYRAFIAGFRDPESLGAALQEAARRDEERSK